MHDNYGLCLCIITKWLLGHLWICVETAKKIFLFRHLRRFATQQISQHQKDLLTKNNEWGWVENTQVLVIDVGLLRTCLQSLVSFVFVYMGYFCPYMGLYTWKPWQELLQNTTIFQWFCRLFSLRSTGRIYLAFDCLIIDIGYVCIYWSALTKIKRI